MRNTTFDGPGKRSKRHQVALLALLLISVPSASVWANPTGGNVVAGSATIGGGGPNVFINQSSNAAIINWHQFSINSGEATTFNVPNVNAATLNRVTGGNPSAIYGSLSSNGKLFLINPSGIVVGPSGRIDTNGFLASTLDVSNEDFLKGGDLHFLGTSEAGINNQGVIHATGGDVYLIAKQVDNNGSIIAPHGNVGLAAGTDVLLQQSGDQHLFVQSKPTISSAARATGVTNAGAIAAASAELKAAGGNAYALAINNTGVVAATGFKKINGQVYLTSDGGNITNSGRISAKTATGDGGKIILNGHGKSSSGTSTTTLGSGTVLNSGQLIANGTGAGKVGGTVQVLGNRVGITDGGLVDVSGDAGGGTALIGGDEHGISPTIVDADETYLGPNARVTADALRTGDGGKIILWANQTTQAYGSISSRGGSISGNGGFVETSAANLDARTVPDIQAPHGNSGTWLLDPTDVFITDTGVDSGNVSLTPQPFTINGTAGSATITQANLLLALQTGNVIIDATQGTGAANGGIITWEQPGGNVFDISSIPGHTLTLNSPVQVGLFGVVITNTGVGSLNLILNSSQSGAGEVVVSQSALGLGGGSFIANGNGYTSMLDNRFNSSGVEVYASTINAQGGNISLTGAGGYSFNSAAIPHLQAGPGVNINGGSTIETTGNGSIAFNGTYSQPGSLNLPTVSGVYIDPTNGVNTVSVDAGVIAITGNVSQSYGSDTFSTSISGVAIDQGNIVKTNAAGSSIVITGDVSNATSYDAGDGLGGNSGVSIGSNDGLSATAQISVATGGNITIIGAAGTSHTNTNSFVPFSNGGGSTGVNLGNSFQLTAAGNSIINIQGAGGTAVIDSGNIETTSFGVSVFNSGKTSPSGGLISSDSGEILIQGVGGTSPNLGIGVVIGGVTQPNGVSRGAVTIQSNTGNILIGGTGGGGNTGPGSFPGFYQPNHGIGIINNATITTGGGLTLNGGGNGAGGQGVAVTEVTDPNFDTAPVIPTLNTRTLFINTSNSTGIAMDANITNNSTSFTVPNSGVSLTGALTTSILSVSAGEFVNIVGTNNIAELGTITVKGINGIEILDGSALDITQAITSSSPIFIGSYDGNLSLTGNGKIVDSGANTFVQLFAEGYFVNNSTAGANALQLSNGTVYSIYSNDPSGTVLGGLTPVTTIFDYTTYFNGGGTLPNSNALLYFTSGTPTPPIPPPNPPNPTPNPNDDVLANQGGINNVLSTVTTQNAQVSPKQPVNPNTLGGSNFVPLAYSGNGVYSQSSGAGDLANSSSGGGLVGSGDAAQLARGELNNIANPAAAGSLNLALSAFVRATLANALSGVADNDSPANGKAVTGGDDNDGPGSKTNTRKKAVASDKEKNLDSGEVAVIGGNGVQNIPLSQAPQQLQNALDDGTLAGMGAPGH